MVWLRQLYFSTQLNKLKRGIHRKFSYTSWPEKEASFHPVHSSCLLTTSNHRHHYQQPDPLITSHPSTKGSWSSHALTATGAQGQWKRLGCNWVFWHAKEISHWTSELQNELREDKGDIFMKVAHVLPSQQKQNQKDRHRIKPELWTQWYSSAKVEAQSWLCSAERQEARGRRGGWGTE